MKVLISAYSCNPTMGSEPHVGEQFIKAALRNGHTVTAVTRPVNKKDILSDPILREVDWIFFDFPPVFQLFRYGWILSQFHYILWQVCLPFVLRRQKKKKWDLAHHVTFGKFWVPSCLGFILPTVFGPVGGGDSVPKSVRGSLSGKLRVLERVRDFSIWFSRLNPLCRLALNQCSIILAATEATQKKIKSCCNSETQLLPQCGVIDEKRKWFEGFKRGSNTDEILFVSAGRLVSWKACDLSIKAFKRYVDGGGKGKYMIVGGGPEENFLKQLVVDLKLEDRVEVTGYLGTLEDVYSVMGRATAFVHPCLREAFGVACIEALTIGVPVIALDQGGPAMMVTHSESGFLVKTETYEDIIEGLKLSFAKMSEMSHGLLEEMSVKSRTDARKFSWDNLGVAVSEIYEKVGAEKSKQP